MKALFPFIILILAALLVSPTYNPKETKTDSHAITVIQINAEWNEKNSVPLYRLKGCNTETAYLEQKSTKIQDEFSKIPIIVITTIDSPNTPVKVWEGNILFEPTTSVEEIQDYINKLK